MAIKSKIGAVCAYLLVIATTPAFGSVIYNYSGNNFDSFSGLPFYIDNAVTCPWRIVTQAAIGS